MSTISSAGASIDRFSDILEKLYIELKAGTFGDNVQQDPRSLIGALTNLFSEGVHDQNELVEQLLDTFNPNSAKGKFLSDLLVLSGLQRKDSEFSTGVVSLTANAAGATVPVGALVSDPNDSTKQFAVDVETVIAPSATEDVSVTAVDAGATTALAGTLTQIDTPEFGWASVTNAADVVVGADRELDSAARQRRNVAASANGKLDEPSLYSRVLNLDGVETVKVIANRTAVTDADGVPPQHIWVITNGGSDADIAKTIFENTAGGIGTYGAETVAHLDETTGDTYDVNFGRAIDVPVGIWAKYITDASYPADGDAQVTQNFVDFFAGVFEIEGVIQDGFGIGDDVLHRFLYAPIQAVPGVTQIDFVKLTTSISEPLSYLTYTEADVIIDTDELSSVALNAVFVHDSAPPGAG